jgi:hypothetical protein
VAGLDLPTKLRRSLGQGRILDVEEVVERLRPYDKDGDGRLTKTELGLCLGEVGLGGPWFCDMFAGTVWRKAQQTFEREVASLPVPLLARVLHFAMARAERPTRRYVITPEAVRGEAPRVDAKNEPVDEPFADIARGAKTKPAGKPRGAPARPPERGPAPRGPAPRGPAPRGPAPRGRAPAPRGRAPAARGAPSRPDPGRGPSRPSGRGGPRRPSGRSRS